jgi:hypothetical protein
MQRLGRGLDSRVIGIAGQSLEASASMFISRVVPPAPTQTRGIRTGELRNGRRPIQPGSEFLLAFSIFYVILIFCDQFTPQFSGLL